MQGRLQLCVLCPSTPRSSGWLRLPATLSWRPQHQEKGWRSTLHNGEARRKGVAQRAGGGDSRSTEEGPSPQVKAGSPIPWLGSGHSVHHHLGTREVKPKVGRGWATAVRTKPCWSWVCEALPQCLVSRTVLCTNRRHMARGDPCQTQPDPVSVFLEGTHGCPHPPTSEHVSR